MSNASDPAREERMINELQRLYAVNTGGGAILIVAGAGVIVLAGIVITSILWFILWNFFGTSYLGWTGWFFVYVLAVVPLLIHEDKRSRGQFLSDATSGMSNPDNASSYGEMQMNRLSAGGAAITELLLWGPRSLINGLTILRGQQPTQFRPLLERAARMIIQLYDDTEAIEMKKLYQAGDTPDKFDRVLKWLDDNGHIGLSSDKTRVWLSSRMRQHLASTNF